MHTILPVISTSCVMISAILVAFGWYHIRKGRRKTHQRLMVAAAICAVLFFTIYSLRTIIFGSAPFNGPDSLRLFYLVFLLFHIVLSTVAAVLGILTVVYAVKGTFLKHKRLGRTTAVIWFCTAVTGFTVFMLLYVLYPAEETTNLWNAIFG